MLVRVSSEPNLSEAETKRWKVCILSIFVMHANAAALTIAIFGVTSRVEVGGS